MTSPRLTSPDNGTSKRSVAARPGRIVLLGEALADVFPDKTVIGGAPFNVACNLAALGAQPLMITRIGQDRLGEEIGWEFARFGLARTGLQRDAVLPTGVVRVTLDESGHHFQILDNQAWDAIGADAAVRETRMADPVAVYFGTLAQRSAASRAAIRQSVQATSAFRFLDLNLRHCAEDASLSQDSLLLANAVKVNEEEPRRLLAWFVEPPLAAAAWGSARHGAAVQDLLRKFDLRYLIVTRSPEGFVAFGDRGGVVAAGTSAKADVVDTVGAGDAFYAVVLLGETLGWPLRLSLLRASEFATAVCTFRGAVATDDSFYLEWQQRWNLERVHRNRTVGN